MGTRADFYVKTGDDLEWLGSITYDGYPDGIDDPVLASTAKSDYTTALADFFKDRDDVTLPERGWPWPWDDSNTTDYGYVLIEGRGVFYCPFGREIYAATDKREDPVPVADVTFTYPNMKDRQNIRFDKGSGMMILRG